MKRVINMKLPGRSTGLAGERGVGILGAKNDQESF